MKKFLLIAALLSFLAVGVVWVSVPNKSDSEKARNGKEVKNILCADCNVILLSVDSLRADRMGAFGYTRDTTPNFDALAKRGALFLNYFTASFLTPVSEMSLHTSLYPTAHGITNFDTILPENIQTLTEYMSEEGYATRALLSSPEFEINPALKKSFSRGFDVYEYAHPDYTKDMRRIPSDEQLRAALDSLAERKSFLWLGIGRVHWPYGEGSENTYADPSYNGILKGKKLDWELFQNIYQGILYPDKTKLTDADIAYVRDMYDNGVSAFDDFLGTLVAELEARNAFQNTIVIVASEHGEDLGEHGYFAHYDVTDTQIHTPLLVLVPEVQGGMRITSLAGSVDIFPTIMELLHDPAPPYMQGKSLVPLISGGEKDGLRARIFSERNPLWEEAETRIRLSLEGKGIRVESGINKDIAIRTPEWKYILRLSEKRMERISWFQTLIGKRADIPEAELYDLKKDPGEMENVIGEHPDIALSLRAELEEWHKKMLEVSPKTIEHVRWLQPYF